MIAGEVPYTIGMRFLVLFATFVLALPVLGEDFPELTLENREGKAIVAKLVGKGEDWVRIEVRGRTHTLPLDKLSDESVALIKQTQLPEVADFRIEVDIKKQGKKIKGQPPDHQSDRGRRPHIPVQLHTLDPAGHRKRNDHGPQRRPQASQQGRHRPHRGPLQG